MYIFWFLHQTTTNSPSAQRKRLLYIFWFLHQTTTIICYIVILYQLYIFWFLHQTTTLQQYLLQSMHCISFDSYIKPQQGFFCSFKVADCISFDSYIKPQPAFYRPAHFCIVYLLIPTSNHNHSITLFSITLLYIFWFLHQTTTKMFILCASFYCISFDSYIKPQLFLLPWCCIVIVYLLIPTSNHNVSALFTEDRNIVYLLIPTSNHNSSSCITRVPLIVYLLIPTSNHNLIMCLKNNDWLYIFWFLHQTTTNYSWS